MFFLEARCGAVFLQKPYAGSMQDDLEGRNSKTGRNQLSVPAHQHLPGSSKLMEKSSFSHIPPVDAEEPAKRGPYKEAERLTHVVVPETWTS